MRNHSINSMKSHTTEIISPVILRAMAAIGLAAGLSACGSGKGGIGESPSPETLNGVSLVIYQGGPEYKFVRAEGDATTGAEVGAVTMEPDPAAVLTFGTGGGFEFFVVPPTRISGARYTYTRTSPETAVITIAGESTNITAQRNEIGGLLPAVNYLMSPFERQFDILFGTDGATVTGVTVNDSGIPPEEPPFPGLVWRDAEMRLQNGLPLPVGWNITSSDVLDLPRFYPDSISKELFIIEPDDPTQNSFAHQFLESTFTRFSDARGDFVERGVGNRNIIDDTVLETINFEYDPDPATTNIATLRIFRETGPSITYELRFLDFEGGTYVRLEDGSTGEFDFPFLED